MNQSGKELIVLSDDDGFDDSLMSSSTLSYWDASSSQRKKSSACRLQSKSKSMPLKSAFKTSYTQSKRKNSWIASSFDGFQSQRALENSMQKTKRTIEPEVHQSKDVSMNLWIDKYKPQSESELAVHKKKIEEVRSWILDNLSTKSSEILLLIGPVGVGKTATVTALSRELEFEVQEWINPTTYNEGIAFGNEYSQSQISQFQDYLLRSNKYPSLNMFGSSNDKKPSQRKVILLEDLPNLFYRDTKKLHEVLLEYRQKGRCPLILIISDSHSDESNLHKLLPKAVQANLRVSTISFNPVANTSLLKALNRIVSLESKKAGKQFLMPPKEVISELAQSSAGDIRTAINALQFSCQKGVQENVLSKYQLISSTNAAKRQKKDSCVKQSKMNYKKNDNKKEKTDEENALKAIGGKDSTIFLFKALGKILYCKREPNVSDEKLLPSHMSYLARNKCQFCPEEVVERSHMSSDMLCLYLHQNYLEFFKDIDDIVVASSYLSDANMVSSEWMHRTSLIPYMSCIATRGLMFNNNYHTVSNPGMSRAGWRPLHKPRWFEVNKKLRDNSQVAKELFPEQTCNRSVLYSQIIPYLAITDVTLHTPGQISFVQQMGYYQKNKFNTRSFGDTLDEKELALNEEDELSSQSSTSKTSTNQPAAKQEQDSQEIQSSVDDNQEDIFIDDFDDDW